MSRPRSLLVPVVALVLAGLAVPPGASAASSVLPSATTAPGSAITMDGGDLIKVSAPEPPLAGQRLGSGWRQVDLSTGGSLPADGAGAAVVTVRVSRAARAGTVSIRAAGGATQGQRAVSYTKTGSSLSTLVSKLGPASTLEIRASGGRPRVTLDVLGYVPETSAFTVPESLPAARDVTFGSKTSSLRVTGRGPVPDGATTVLAVLHTTARRSATVSAWQSGLSRPATGHAVPRGAHQVLLPLSPSAAGKVSLAALSGAAKGRLQVVGWSAPGVTLAPLARPARLAAVKPGATRTLAVTGRAGVPDQAESVVVSVNAPKGSRVRIWTEAALDQTLELDTRSRGGSVAAWVPVSGGGDIAVRVEGTRKAATVSATAYVSDPGAQTLSIVPKPATRLLGSGDIRATGDGWVDLAPSADGLTPDGHVLARPSGSAPFVGRVVSIQDRADGVRRVQLAAATIPDAFDDYDATYDGPLTGEVAALETLRESMRTSSAGSSPGRADTVDLPLFGSDLWECNGSVPVSELVDIDADFSGDAYLDMDLDQRSVDFSAKGSFEVTFTFLGEAAVSCTLDVTDTEWYPRIPLGVTGVAVTFGGQAEFTAAMPDTSDGGSLTARASMNLYAGFYYFDGTSGGALSGSVDGDVDANYDGLSLSFRPDLLIGVGPSFPPGVAKRLDASASVAVGAELTVGVPDQLRGPRCLDVAVQPHIETGAEAVVDLLGIEATVDWEGKSWEGPETVLYRGPCWGWSGTITYEARGSTTPTGDGGSFVTRADRAVVTPLSEPARFVGGDVLQPYSWTADTDYLYTGPTFGDPPRRCFTRQIGAGSGTHPFGGTPEHSIEPVIVRDVPAGGDVLPRHFQAVINEYPIEVTTSSYGGDESCFAETTTGEGYVYIAPGIDPTTHPLPFWAPVNASYAWSNENPEIEESVVYALTRQEYERD